MLSNIINQCLIGHPVRINGKWHTSSLYIEKNPEGSQWGSLDNYRAIYFVGDKYNESYGRILSSLIEKKYSNLEEKKEIGFIVA